MAHGRPRANIFMASPVLGQKFQKCNSGLFKRSPYYLAMSVKEYELISKIFTKRIYAKEI